jgi:hypothetical protein
VGSDVAEAQIDDLSDAEIESSWIYEVLRLTPRSPSAPGSASGKQ